MKKHPVALLAESQGLNGYQFRDWLGERSDSELNDLKMIAYTLGEEVKREQNNRILDN